MHAWLGPLSERGVGDSPCRVKTCGLLKSALVHRGMDPEFLTGIPDPEELFRPVARPVHATDLIPAVQAWDSYSAQVRDIIVRKSEGYGDAWQAQGYMGNLARVMSKEARLRNMLWGDNTDGDYSEGEVHPEYESVMDTLVDLGALAAFMVSNLEEGNRWGR